MKSKASRILRTISILCALMAILCFFLIIACPPPEDAYFLVLWFELPILPIIASIVTGSISKGIKKSHERELFIEQGHWKVPCLEFYKICKHIKLSSFSNPTELKRAQLIIEDLLAQENLPTKYSHIYSTEEKLTTYYKQGRQLYTAEQIKEIERKKEEERCEQKRLNTPIRTNLNDTQQKVIDLASRLMRHRGNEKRIHWLSEILETEQNKLTKINRKLYDLGKEINDYSQPVEWEKPVDWAIMGGLAQAIGGPAAGVMAAMETQESNAGVTERNIQRIETNKKLLSYAKNEQYTTTKEQEHQLKIVKQVQSDLNKIKFKLDFDTVSATELFANLELSGTVNYNKDTLEITVDVKNNFTPPEIEGASTPLVVDGVLIAKVICRNILVDSVKILLPVNGLKKDESSQITSYTEYRLPNMSEKYTVEFEPLKLWIMER